MDDRHVVRHLCALSDNGALLNDGRVDQSRLQAHHADVTVHAQQTVAGVIELPLNIHNRTAEVPVSGASPDTAAGWLVEAETNKVSNLESYYR